MNQILVESLNYVIYIYIKHTSTTLPIKNGDTLHVLLAALPSNLISLSEKVGETVLTKASSLVRDGDCCNSFGFVFCISGVGLIVMALFGIGDGLLVGV